MNTGFSMALVTALFIMFYIKERVSKAKLLQIVSGANKFVFWSVAFIIDYIILFLISLFYILIMFAYQKEGFSTFDELFRITLLLLVFGFAILPFTYVLSFAFKVPTTGLVTSAIAFIVTGTLFYTVYFVLISELFDLRWVGDPLGWTFLLFPHYSLTRGMSNLNIMQSTIAACDRQCVAVLPTCDYDMMCNTDLRCDMIMIPEQRFLCDLQVSCCKRDFFTLEEEGISIMLIAMVVVGFVSFILLFFIEYRVIKSIIGLIFKPKM